jgi:hypothetical protein
MVLLAWDHCILATGTFGKCKPYEMISSALWALEADGKLMGRIFRPIVDVCAYLLGSRQHCFNSYTWQLHLYNSKVDS